MLHQIDFTFCFLWHKLFLNQDINNFLNYFYNYLFKQLYTSLINYLHIFYFDLVPFLLAKIFFSFKIY